MNHPTAFDEWLSAHQAARAAELVRMREENRALRLALGFGLEPAGSGPLPEIDPGPSRHPCAQCGRPCVTGKFCDEPCRKAWHRAQLYANHRTCRVCQKPLTRQQQYNLQLTCSRHCYTLWLGYSPDRKELKHAAVTA